MAISFPASPSNGDRYVTGGTTYTYSSTDNKWTGIIEVDAPGIAPENMSVTNTPAAEQVLQYVNDNNFQWVDLPRSGSTSATPTQSFFVAAGTTGTFTVPDGVTDITVFAVGGGGGSLANAHGNRGGGGRGGVGFLLAQSVVAGETISYTVGTGGHANPAAPSPGDTSNYTGGTGGTTTITATNWTMTATGGTGGTINGAGPGGGNGSAGSASTTGTIDATGGFRSTTGVSADYLSWIDFFIAGTFAAQDVLGPLQAQVNGGGSGNQTWNPTGGVAPGGTQGTGWNQAGNGQGAGGGVIFIYS